MDHPEQKSADSSNDINAEEQAAFQKIIGEIESQNKATGDEPDSKATEDFSDGLTKVVKEAHAIDSVDVTEAQGENPEDGLDEDQHKALERIMAQIEGGGKSEADTYFEAETQDQPDAEAKDDVSAELTKVLQEADAAESNDSQEVAPKGGDDVLDEDRQKELEIDDILKSITEEEETPLPESADDQAEAELAVVTAPKENILVDDIVDSRKDDNVPKHLDSSPEVNPDAKDPISSVPKGQKPAEAQLPSGQPANLTPAPASPSAPPKARALRETSKSTGGRKKRTVLASATFMVMLALVGYVYLSQGGIVKPKRPGSVLDTNLMNAAVAPQPIAPSPQPATATQAASNQSRLKTAADNLDYLRNDLIEKQVEIEELRTYYQTGIDAEIQDIADTVRQAGKGKLSFKAAVTDPQIRLGLSAIQRRDTYVKKLQAPLNTLFHNSEALLYFSRKADLLSLMAASTSDIDVDGFIEQADEVRRMHSIDLAQLNIDAIETSPLPLESIWEDIVKRLPARPIQSKNKLTAVKSDNAAIWKQICKGDFTRKHKLTALSAEAARCLAAWKGKDLFLNGLTELSADTARQLAVWEGDWLGLNGLTELSPEAAMHLSRWKGKKLSLNGLSRLSPRVVAILSEWQGEQIELVNVKHMAHWENDHTRLFLSEDLNRRRKATRN